MGPDRGTVEEGARNAVEVCMGVRKGERVLVVTDREVGAVGQALADAAEAVTPGHVTTVLLEDLGERPLTELPDALAEQVPDQDVTFYAASALPGELGLRAPFIDLAKTHARHGHMPGITEAVMRDGMCADQKAIHRMTERVNDAVKDARTCRVTTPAGTDLEVRFEADWRWNPCGGLVHEQGGWGNLPEGETFTAVPWGQGTVVAEELGDHFCPKYGDLGDDPVAFDVVEGRVDLDSIEGGPGDLATELREYLSTDGESDRLGEFAFGTHVFLDGFVGNLLQDEKYPGVHVAFGYPYPDRTGADWTSTTHVDVIMKACTAQVDGRKILEDGRYIL